MTPGHATDAAVSRPRVEGDREQQILDATLEVLGRRRLRPAHHGRRRHPRQGLQGHALPALERQGQPGHRRPALGARAPRAARHRHPARRPASRRSAAWAASPTSSRWPPSPASSPRSPATRSSPRRSGARSSAPRPPLSRAIFERARDRGEIRPDVDIDLLAPALAGIVLHRMYVMGELPDEALDHPRHRPDHPPGRHRPPPTAHHRFTEGLPMADLNADRGARPGGSTPTSDGRSCSSRSPS